MEAPSELGLPVDPNPANGICFIVTNRERIPEGKVSKVEAASQRYGSCAN
jgi:hypothetical protein